MLSRPSIPLEHFRWKVFRDYDDALSIDVRELEETASDRRFRAGGNYRQIQGLGGS